REAAARVADADDRIERAVREFRSATEGLSDIGTIVRYRNWIDREREHAAVCRRQHDEQRAVADKAAVVLQTAMRQVKVMERLRDRARRRHLQAERRSEMKELDQLATLQFARRNSAQGADREY